MLYHNIQLKIQDIWGYLRMLTCSNKHQLKKLIQIQDSVGAVCKILTILGTD